MKCLVRGRWLRVLVKEKTEVDDMNDKRLGGTPYIIKKILFNNLKKSIKIINTCIFHLFKLVRNRTHNKIIPHGQCECKKKVRDQTCNFNKPYGRFQ